MRHGTVLVSVAVALLAGPLWAQPAGDFKSFAQAQLTRMADANLPPAARADAREEILKQAGPQATVGRTDKARILADLVPAYLKSKDPLTQLNAAMIAAQVQHLHFVPILQDAISSPNAVVRYWAAKGLRDSQADMFGLGGPQFFEKPIAALANQAVVETEPLVVQEIYQALGRTNPALMTDRRRNQQLYQAFAKAFEARIKRLDEGKVQGVAAETVGLEVSAQWEGYYRRDEATRGNILFQQGQLLKWAAQTYNYRFKELSGQRKGELERVILAASDVLARELGLSEFNERMVRHTGDPLTWELEVIDLAGAPGLSEFALARFGVKNPAADLAALKKGAANESADNKVADTK